MLENAFKHNIIEEVRPLHIEVLTENDFLVIRNNLQVRRLVEDSNGQGLENLNKLYQYLTGNPVAIESTESHFTVKVPLL
ncbi:MAG: hypothetical protein KIT62_03395 [Cyclobacteriaceae bacterium]|nr:hypothetical protein [Cyclobacteriaceae bacterium]